jgi:hypothetical protein
MKRPLSLDEAEPVESVRIAASFGSEVVLPFYDHYGFLPKANPP